MIFTRRQDLLVCGLILAASYPSSAIAQSEEPDAQPAKAAAAASVQSFSSSIDEAPIRSPLDGNGVNLATGALTIASQGISVGASGSSLSYSRTWTSGRWQDGYLILIAVTTNSATVTIGSTGLKFTRSGSNFVSDTGDGSTLAAGSLGYVYTASDGTVITFDTAFSGKTYSGYPAVTGLGRWIDRPGGSRIALWYKTSSSAARLQSVTDASGHMIKYKYGTDFSKVMKVTAIRLTDDYCDPNADSCGAGVVNWPTLDYTYVYDGSLVRESVTDASGQATRYTMNSAGQLVGINRPSSSSDNVTYAYGADGRVSSVSAVGATWNYAWALAATTLTATVTGPLSYQRVTTADTDKMVITTDRDALNRTSTFLYDAKGRLTHSVPPEGTIDNGTPTAGYAFFQYDTRGNVTCSMQVAKSASGAQSCALPSTANKIVATALYAASCANALTCNKPQETADARGNVTNYAYDSATGFVTSVTSPAPTPGAVRPQTRYSYSTLWAFYKQSTGALPTQAPTSMVKLTGISNCVTASSCTGGGDEVKTTIGYGPQASGTPNPLYPVSITNAAGDGATPSLTTCLRYDRTGNLVSKISPKGNASSCS